MLYANLCLSELGQLPLDKNNITAKTQLMILLFGTCHNKVSLVRTDTETGVRRIQERIQERATKVLYHIFQTRYVIACTCIILYFSQSSVPYGTCLTLATTMRDTNEQTHRLAYKHFTFRDTQIQAHARVSSCSQSLSPLNF